MFITSVKLKRPRLLLAVFVVVIAALVIWLALSAFGNRPELRTLATEADRQQFIRDMGWQTSPEYSECRSITIPADWSEVYSQYNELQKQQGFDLEPYKGKAAEVYSYPVYNYEGHTEKDCMRLTLIVCGCQLIGGDVCCTELGGFMQGLKKATS